MIDQKRKYKPDVIAETMDGVVTTNPDGTKNWDLYRALWGLMVQREKKGIEDFRMAYWVIREQIRKMGASDATIIQLREVIELNQEQERIRWA